MEPKPTEPNFSPLSATNANDQKDAAAWQAAHPFLPSGWEPKKSPADILADQAVRRYAEMQKLVGPLAAINRPADPNNVGEKNIEFIIARIRRLEQMIDGATISASCSTTSSTITVTLNWGAS